MCARLALEFALSARPPPFPFCRLLQMLAKQDHDSSATFSSRFHRFQDYLPFLPTQPTNSRYAANQSRRHNLKYPTLPFYLVLHPLPSVDRPPSPHSAPKSSRPTMKSGENLNQNRSRSRSRGRRHRNRDFGHEPRAPPVRMTEFPSLESGSPLTPRSPTSARNSGMIQLNPRYNLIEIN